MEERLLTTSQQAPLYPLHNNPIYYAQANSVVNYTPKHSREQLAYDVVFTFATQGDSVADVTITDCQTQNGSALCRVFAAFERLFSLDKLENRSTGKLRESVFYSFPIDVVGDDASSFGIPFK